MGCFSGVEFWLARKWRRVMDRQRRRMQARSTRPAKPDVSCAGDGTGLRASRGGVAFNLTLNDRVPTPFRGFTPRPASSSSLSAMDRRQRFETTLARREGQLQQKLAFARQCNRKRETVRADTSKSEEAIYAVRDIADGEEECLTGANSPCH